MDEIDQSTTRTALAVATERQIVVSFINGRVHGEPNPASAEPGDTVTWLLDRERLDLEIQFSAVRELPSGPLEETVSTGPFDSLTHQRDRITGTIKTFTPDPGHIHRFYYRIIVNGLQIAWDNPVPGAPDPLMNGGGLDVPGRPPGT